MAKVIKFEELQEGFEYWEEWSAGTACLRCKVLRIRPRGTIEMRYWGDGTRTWTQATLRDPHYRYWDEEPTCWERQEARWS